MDGFYIPFPHFLTAGDDGANKLSSFLPVSRVLNGVNDLSHIGSEAQF